MSEDKKNGKQNKTVKPFDPMTLRGVTVRNRIWLPPMDTYSALAQDGKPTPFHYQHYVSRAMGGFGMIIMEATAVAPEGRISPCDLGLWDDGQMDAWRWIVADAKAAGATMAVQLNHAGRKGSTGCHAIGFDGQSVPEEQGGWRTVCPSANAYGSLARPRALSVDEIHTIVGAGSTQGSLDTANILKPALARGELQTIGATTLDEYRENIETDSALERRFQKVVIEPTTPEQTLQILRNIAPHYERHHKVHYTEEALQACVTLTGRYVTDRYFPDKAIDALDEAGSRAHLQSAREPEELRAMKTALSDAKRERREAVEALVYEKAASARMREIALRSKLGESRAEWKRSLESNPVEITARHIQEVITAMTGIPAERVSDGEMIRLQTLREHLAKRVVGQQEAVEKISRTIRRSRAGLKDENRPIGVFLFVGPTGVGKTLLAKEVSKWLFDERRGLIRIDMSEYGEKHNVARLIGSPPGYVGYGEGGQLTEAVRRQPYAVVLFDEIEKAHPEVFNAMLQIFDEGHLTDGSGRKVDFRNTIIIMTSNVGSRAVVRKSVQVGYSTTSKSAVADRTPQSEYRKALEQTFAPEFLNRIDDIILFRTLEIADVERIIELELQGLLNRTKKLGYKVKITEGAKRRLAAMGYESRYGVRSLKRTLMDNVEEPLSSLIIDGKLHEGDTVVVESDKAHGVKLRVA